MVEWHGKVGVSDGGDESGVFGGGRERAESVTMNWDVDREDGGDFYSSWGRRDGCGRGHRKGSATG